MKHLNIYLILILKIVVFCAYAQNTTIPTINPTTFKESNILLSELVDEISWVEFDTPTPLQAIMDYHVDEREIILNTPDNVMRFDRKGKLKNVIAEDEDCFFTNMAINKTTREIYLLGNKTDKLFTYTFGGKQLSVQELPKQKIRYPESFIYDDEKLYFMFSTTVSDSPKPQYEWATMDIHSSNPILKEASTKVWGQPQRGPLYIIAHNNQLLYWNIFNDFVYRLKGNTYNIAYQWAKGDYRFNLQDGAVIHRPIRNDCLRLFSLCETEKYLFMEFRETDSLTTYLYNRQNKESRKAAKLTDDIWGTGLKLLPENYYKLKGREYLTVTIKSEKLKDELLKSKNIKGKQVAQQIDEEGGVILLLLRLRQ